MSTFSISEETHCYDARKFVVDVKPCIPFLFLLWFSVSLELVTVSAVGTGNIQQVQALPGQEGHLIEGRGRESTECPIPFESESEEGKRMGQATNSLMHVDFEVDGIVQGVFFRKYTQKEANKLGLRGFCRNTSAGTVTGSMEGSRQAIDQMKQWLRYTGSPMSRIDGAVFSNEKQIDSFTFSPGFDIASTQ